MAAEFWTALTSINRIQSVLGLPAAATIVGSLDVQTSQILTLMNEAGSDLVTMYPWTQMTKEFPFSTVNGQEDYPIPSDVAYFTDQTQWDRTNRWPLLGPKSPQEWAWLKGSLVAPLPRRRFRIVGSGTNQVVKLYPVPDATVTNIVMEYTSSQWVYVPPGTSNASYIINDTDVVMFDPWLFLKYTKLKFYQLKGFETTAAERDFMTLFLGLTGKDTGADKLSLTPSVTPPFIGVNSVPDGNWNV